MIVRRRRQQKRTIGGGVFDRLLRSALPLIRKGLKALAKSKTTHKIAESVLSGATKAVIDNVVNKRKHDGNGITLD